MNRISIPINLICLIFKIKTRPEGIEPSTSDFGDLRSTN